MKYIIESVIGCRVTPSRASAGLHPREQLITHYLQRPSRGCVQPDIDMGGFNKTFHLISQSPLDLWSIRYTTPVPSSSAIINGALEYKYLGVWVDNKFNWN